MIAGFQDKTLVNPYEDLDCNPYADEACVTMPEQTMVGMDEVVCGYKYEGSDCGTYKMVTYGTWDEATADGAIVSHTGACGLCSTAQDLAVYMAIPDMTSAGKKCATKGLIHESWGKKCYEELGYTTPCASIWNYDGIYDGKKCFGVCIKELFSDLNGPPPMCELNECLKCDEVEAGPLFKAFAGRTRRRSGIASAIARGCDEFAHITHEVCPPAFSDGADTEGLLGGGKEFCDTKNTPESCNRTGKCTWNAGKCNYIG